MVKNNDDTSNFEDSLESDFLNDVFTEDAELHKNDTQSVANNEKIQDNTNTNNNDGIKNANNNENNTTTTNSEEELMNNLEEIASTDDDLIDNENNEKEENDTETVETTNNNVEENLTTNDNNDLLEQENDFLNDALQEDAVSEGQNGNEEENKQEVVTQKTEDDDLLENDTNEEESYEDFEPNDILDNLTNNDETENNSNFKVHNIYKEYKGTDKNDTDEEEIPQNNKKYESNKEFPNVPVKNENTSQATNSEEHTHVSRQTKSGVKSSINELIENVKNQMLNDRNKVSKPTFSEGKTLEQFIADIMQPHVVDYLDKNIERIVKDIVQHEIQKIIDDTK